MGALFCLGIDNALIEIDNEVPILDGSAKKFIENISLSGIESVIHQLKLLK